MNMKLVTYEGLTFDDVLLLPGYTQVKREDIDVSTFLSSKVKLSIPLISSPMDTVTTSEMAIALGKLGGLGIIHRNMTVEKQVEEVVKVAKVIPIVGAAVGIGADLSSRTEALAAAGATVIVVDSAHGFSKWVVEATKFISQKYPDITLVSGSVATAEGARALIEAGADTLRVGMGPGSICTTRVVAGMGVPQLTALFEAVSEASQKSIPVIADGGLRTSGDIVKALAAGASTIMSGSLFAGCFEAPGKVTTMGGKKYKTYRGMGSVSAMKEGSAARYGQNYHKGQERKLIAEGVEGRVPYKGSLENMVTQLVGGLRTGMYYLGAQTLAELWQKARFIKISHASLQENAPHDILDINPPAGGQISKIQIKYKI